MKGLFITFEGPDASGKTTQIKLLEEYLIEKKGITPLMTREPGGTPISEKIRDIILDKANSEMSPVTEALLYAASRAQHVQEVIVPALEAGRVVISDRFLDSSIAYQGYGRDMGSIIADINAPATGGLEPDLTIFLKTDPAHMRSRRSAADEDRMDAQRLDFHMKVLEGYCAIAAAEPQRVKTIDGERDIETIASEIRRLVDSLFEGKSLA